MKRSFLERLITRVKTHRVTTAVIALGGIIIALSSFTDAAKNLAGVFSSPGPEEARASLQKMGLPYTPEAFVRAASDGDAIAIKLFLTAGIEIDAPAYLESRVERLPALAAAAFEVRGDVVKLLLESGAQVITPDYNCLVAAAVSGNIGILNAMLRERIDQEHLDEAFVVADRTVVLEALVRAGVSIPRVGLLALQQATSAESVNYLADQGVNVTTPDAKGKTPLQHLMDNPIRTDAGAVLAMIDQGADINTRDRRGSTLLLRAADNGNVQMTRRLLDRTADLTVRDVEGRTALLLAAELNGKRALEIATLLLTHGADVNARDADGATALHRAARQNNLELAQLLLEHNANIHVKDTRGQTALSLAERFPAPDNPVADLLRSHGARENQ